MELDGQRHEELQEAILKAYQKEELEMLLRQKMEIQFEAIASGSRYDIQVFKLIEYFYSRDNLEDFIKKLAEDRPNNTIFQEMNPKPIAEPASGDRPDSPGGQMGIDSRFYIPSNLSLIHI